MFPQTAFNLTKNYRIGLADMYASAKLSSLVSELTADVSVRAEIYGFPSANKAFVINSGGRFAEIKCGTTTISAKYSSVSGLIYIANLASNTITVINPTTLEKVGVINANSPFGFTEDVSAGRLYVCNNVGGQLTGINYSSSTIVSSTTVGNSPLNSFFYSGSVLVSNFGSGSISVINASSQVLTATVSGIGQPYTAAYCTTNGYIYVASRSFGGVYLIDPTSWTIFRSISLGGGCIGVTYLSAYNNIYVTNTNTGTVSVISCSSQSVLVTITVGGKPREIVRNIYDGFLYVSNRSLPYISVIDPNDNTVVGTVKIGATSSGLTYCPVTNSVYATSTEIGSVFVIPPNSF